LTQAKFFAYAELLAEHGPNLKRPYADPVRGKIRELRPRQARVLYFFAVERKIILVHGVIKKTQKLDSADIDLAEGRMMDWLSRQTGGGK
jgi:phage-related protein